MKRLVSVLAAIVVCLGVAGCVGDTDPATNITNLSAKLNAHGYTNNGPATWWWEYDTVKADLGTANDSEVCGNPHEADRRCGPAGGGSPGSPVPLSVTITGLTPNTTYYFRACGKDQSAAQAVCGQTRSFKTLAGSSYAYDRQWGSYGYGNGQFTNPSDIATDTAGNVYVADAEIARIQKFSSTGAYLDQWGCGGGECSDGTANGQFRRPVGVATDPAGNVYVADVANHRIQKFTSGGDYIAKWGTLGWGNGQFHDDGPSDVATDSAGNVYVADGNRIQKFSSTGAYITQWGAVAQSVAADAAGNVYALDGSFSGRYVQKFSSTGTWLSQWGSFGRAGLGEFFAPSDVSTDSAGDVYVADTFNYRIQRFGSTGSYMFGTQGSGNGQFGGVVGVAVDPTGNAYVVDLGNHRIQKFKPVQ